MNTYNRVFASSAYATLVLILCSILFKTVIPCSPNPNKPYRDITELAILAPIVLIARVVNTSVDSNIQMFTEYSACLDVKEIIKNENSVSVPKAFCTKQFGTEAMCLSHVFANSSYVFYLDNNLQARYDADFSAVRPATNVVVALARKGYCDVQDNSTNCVVPNMTDVPKKLLTIDEGENVILNCRASGKPYVVTWFFKGDSKGMPLFSRTRADGSLLLRQLTRSTQGKYTCIVKNAAGSVSHQTNLLVKLESCGGVVMVNRNRKLNIISPNFPYEYPPDKTCVWRVCPPRSYRLKFHFNEFLLHRSDAIRIDNECDNSHGDPWRKYCGDVSPGEFVSRCKNSCVQLRLLSKLKYDNREPFMGMNVTVEPTRKKRTKRFNVLKYYCDSDLVIKGRYIERNPWPYNKVKMFALDSFKQPYAQNGTYTIVYNDEDTYGCFYIYDFVKDYFYFGTAKNDVFNVKTAIAADSRQAVYLKKMLTKYKYKNKDSLCKPK